MDVIALVAARVEDVRRAGERPVVVVDIDSTVVVSGERHRRILVEYAEHADRDDLRALAASVGAADFRWSVDEPLARAGLATPEVVADLHRFWAARFFADAYGGLDLPAPGASGVVRGWVDAGALVVWLTARPASTMGACTPALLRRWGFPLFDGRALLVMKEDGVSDAAHKVRAFERIRALGRVVAVLDNEPGHVNAAADAFPDALAVLVGDIHAPDAPPPGPATVRLAAWR